MRENFCSRTFHITYLIFSCDCVGFSIGFNIVNSRISVVYLMYNIFLISLSNSLIFKNTNSKNREIKEGAEKISLKYNM